MAPLRCVVVGVVLSGEAVAAADAPPGADPGAQLDALVAPHFSPDQPGAAVLVRKGDQVLLRKGYGRATFDPPGAVAPEMVFRVGSVTKQFTAAAIMLLVEAGKVSLGDDLRKWVPQFPDYGGRITVEQLLTHTSGVPSFADQPRFQAPQNVDLTHDQVLAVAKDLPLEFTPGTEWVYSNSGYYLLGVIIEKASGTRYSDFMAEKIFNPLGMKHTRCGGRGPALPDDVRGYIAGASPPKEVGALNLGPALAAGALMSSVDDLAIWDRAISAGSLLRKESWRRVFTSMRLADGSATHYGFGWTLGDYEGHRVQHHSGAVPGFTSVILRMPDDQVVVAILCNSMPARAPLVALAMALAAVASGKPIVDPPVVAVKPALLDQYAGLYAGPGTLRLAVRHLGNQLLLQPGGSPHIVKPQPASDTAFFIRGTLVRFSFLRDAKSGRVTRMEERRDDGAVEVYARTDEPLPEQRTIVAVEPAVLQRYVGEYEWRPGVTITVTLEGAHFYVQATGEERVEVFPSSPTEFFLKVIDAQLTFQADGNGPAQRLVLHTDGRDLPHRRIR